MASPSEQSYAVISRRKVIESDDRTKHKACQHERRRWQPADADAPSRWDGRMRLPLASERDTRKTGGGQSPSESAINAYDCFCPLSSLRGNGFNEVACDWSGCCISPPPEHRPKEKIQKNSTNGQLCTIIHYKSHTDGCGCPLCWICSLDPCGERKETSVMGYMACCDLWGHGYRLSSWDPDSQQRLAGSTAISAALRPTTPGTPAVRQRGLGDLFHLQEEKLFQQDHKCAHIWKRAVWVSGCSQIWTVDRDRGRRDENKAGTTRAGKSWD